MIGRSDKYVVECELTHGAVASIQKKTDLKFATIAGGSIPTVTAIFRSPAEALLAAATLANDPDWYVEARAVARKAAQAIPTRTNLDAYPPRLP